MTFSLHSTHFWREREREGEGEGDNHARFFIGGGGERQNGPFLFSTRVQNSPPSTRPPLLPRPRDGVKGAHAGGGVGDTVFSSPARRDTRNKVKKRGERGGGGACTLFRSSGVSFSPFLPPPSKQRTSHARTHPGSASQNSHTEQNGRRAAPSPPPRSLFVRSKKIKHHHARRPPLPPCTLPRPPSDEPPRPRPRGAGVCARR